MSTYPLILCACEFRAQLQAASVAAQCNLHQADVAAGAVVESHLTPFLCLLMNVGHSCKQQQQQRSRARRSSLQQPDGSAGAVLNTCVFVDVGHSCKQQQQQPSRVRRSSLQQHKPASRLSVQLLRWGRNTGLPARPRPRPRSCRARWQSSRWLAGQKKPNGPSSKPKSERACVLGV